MGCCGHGNEPLSTLNGGKFLDELSVLLASVKSSASCSWSVSYYSLTSTLFTVLR